MWKVECLETERSHVELRARERLMIAARDFQEPITEAEAKQKVLDLLKVCSTRDFEGVDSKTNLHSCSEYLKRIASGYGRFLMTDATSGSFTFPFLR